MSRYDPNVDFEEKDTFITGDPKKIVKGSELSSEFSAVQVAVNSKADSSSPTLTGTGTAVNLTVSGTLNANGTLQVGGVAISATAAELNLLDGVTATTAELNKVDGFTGTVADLNYAADLRATGVTATEFDYLDGVTSNIQSQLDAKEGTITDTDDIAEGTNLYYTDGRVDTRIAAEVDKAFVDALDVNADQVDGKDISVVTQATYDGLTPDANTIYFVTD